MASQVNEWGDVLDAIADTGYETDNRFKHGVFQPEREPIEPDMVNSPPHYNQGEIEAIDAIKAALGPEGFRAYCRGSALKYLWRAELKHKTNKTEMTEDWAKANWYINRAIEEAGG